MEYLNLKILSPKEPLYQEKIGSVILPGSEGEMNILPRHVSLISQLKEGTIKVLNFQQQELTSFIIKGGYVHVTPEECVVLTL